MKLRPYDCEGNLACVSNAVSGAVSLYWYDQHGRRVAKSENGLLTLYIWDGMDIIATAHADGTIREYFTRGIGIAGDVGSLVAETRFSGGTATTTYLHSNWRGDVVMATDASGNVVGEYSYTTFGEQLSSAGNFVPRFTFSSKERDASGLVYHGFRYYSPVLCRWISEDPIREFGGINLYQFCGNDPVNRVDADGEIAPLILGLGALVILGAEWANAPGPADPVYPGGEGFADMTVTLAEIASANAGWQAMRNALPRRAGSKICNPFKGKTPRQLDRMFRKKGFTPKGIDPVVGKGSYINPQTGRQYYIDKGGVYRKGTELPHVDVHRPSTSSLPKKKFQLGDSLYE